MYKFSDTEDESEGYQDEMLGEDGIKREIKQEDDIVGIKEEDNDSNQIPDTAAIPQRNSSSRARPGLRTRSQGRQTESHGLDPGIDATMLSQEPEATPVRKRVRIEIQSPPPASPKEPPTLTPFEIENAHTEALVRVARWLNSLQPLSTSVDAGTEAGLTATKRTEGKAMKNQIEKERYEQRKLANIERLENNPEKLAKYLKKQERKEKKWAKRAEEKKAKKTAKRDKEDELRQEGKEGSEARQAR